MIYLMMFWKMKSIRQQGNGGTIVSKNMLSALVAIGDRSCSFVINCTDSECRFDSCTAHTIYSAPFIR